MCRTRPGPFATLAVMALAAAWVPQMTRFPSLRQHLQAILAYVTPPVVAVFLLGIFWPRGNNRYTEYALVHGLSLAEFRAIVADGGNSALVVVRLQSMQELGRKVSSPSNNH